MQVFLCGFNSMFTVGIMEEKMLLNVSNKLMHQMLIVCLSGQRKCVAFKMRNAEETGILSVNDVFDWNSVTASD